MNGSSSRASSWLNWAQQPREAGGLGLAPHQAAGVVGNLVHESGQDLSPWGPTGDNGTAWGTAQWRGDRLAKLKSMFPDNYQTTEAQQAFMRHEMDTTENGAYQKLLAAQSPEEAATAVNRYYERSADNTGGREQAARQLMAQFGGDTSSPGALTSSFASTGNKSNMPSPALSADDTLGTGALNTSDKPDNVYDGLMGMAASLAGISNPDQARALVAQAQLGKKTQGSWSHQIMPNGQLMMSNTNGQTKIIGKPGDYSKDDTYTPVHYYDQATGQTVDRVFNKNTGKYVDQDGQGTTAAPAVGGDQALQGQDRYNSMTPDEQRMIDGWHEGTGVNPTTLSQRNPRIARLMEAAQAVYGSDMDFTRYGERQNFAKGYSNKSPMAYGGQIIGTDHTAALVKQMAETLAGLGNSSGGLWGYGQTAANMLKDATGTTADPNAQKNDRANILKDAKQKAETLSGEYQTLITRGKGGGQGEREQKTNEIYQPDAAPEVQAAPLQSMLNALKARHQEYLEAAKVHGESWVAKHPDITHPEQTINEAQAAIDRLYSLNRTKTAPAAAPAAAPAPASGGKRPPLASFF